MMTQKEFAELVKNNPNEAALVLFEMAAASLRELEALTE